MVELYAVPSCKQLNEIKEFLNCLKKVTVTSITFFSSSYPNL